MDKILSNKLLSLLPTLFPGMSKKTYQEVINNMTDIKPIIYNLNKINELLLTDTKIEIIPADKNEDIKVNKSYTTDLFFDMQIALSNITNMADSSQMKYFTAFMFGYLNLMSCVGGMLGYSKEIILTEWKTFILKIKSGIEGTYGYGYAIPYDVMTDELFIPLFDKAYNKGYQLREYLTTVIGGDIGNLSTIVIEIDKIKERQDDDLDYLVYEINSHYNGSILHTNQEIGELKRLLLPRIEFLEELQATIEGSIEETVNTNSEKIDKIDELLVSPISSFYAYKESNSELYKSELRIFANIFQDVLDLGYISIQSDIEKNLSIIIKGGEEE